MAIGSCTSCSPVLDAAKLSSNPKADLNKDGKISAAELQTQNIVKGTEEPNQLATSSKDDLKANADNKTSTYIAQKNSSVVSGGNILLLAQSNATS